MDFAKELKKYASLLVNSGINLKKGEGLIITAVTDALPLARLVTDLAYAAGAKDVILYLNDDAMARSRYEYGDDDALSFYPEYKALHLKELYDDHYHHLFLIAPNPSLYQGIEGEKISRFQKKAATVTKETGLMAYRMTGKTKWTIAAVPSEAWAASVFPEISAEAAAAKLWPYVFQATRAAEDDPVKAWQTHDRKLKQYRNYLNRMDFDRLHFTGPGTDLTVCLAEGHFWMGGSKESQDGDAYIANIPTEEVFTTPHRLKVDGKVTCTKPLNLNGNLVDGIVLTFDKGKVVDFTAAVGADVLERQLNQDEGARRLGEIALVQRDSPIANTGLIFNNTLFDENASCHLALGQSYGYAMRSDADTAPEDLRARGANDSIIHTDIMIGDEHTEIFAYTQDGRRVQLFKAGNWLEPLAE